MRAALLNTSSTRNGLVAAYFRLGASWGSMRQGSDFSGYDFSSFSARYFEGKTYGHKSKMLVARP